MHDAVSRVFCRWVGWAIRRPGPPFRERRFRRAYHRLCCEPRHRSGQPDGQGGGNTIFLSAFGATGPAFQTPTAGIWCNFPRTPRHATGNVQSACAAITPLVWKVISTPGTYPLRSGGQNGSHRAAGKSTVSHIRSSAAQNVGSEAYFSVAESDFLKLLHSSSLQTCPLATRFTVRLDGLTPEASLSGAVQVTVPECSSTFRSGQMSS